jgi:hypothetical protein
VARQIAATWSVVLPIAFFFTLVGWALTSPVGSSPDDDYHLSSIWCAGGERDGVCEVDPGNSMARLVPESVGFAHECFAYDASVTAACTEQIGSGLVSTERVNNTAGLYPTSFYRVMNTLVGPDEQRSVVMMRVLNAAIAAGLLALALRVLTPAVRSAVVVVVLVVYVPLALFIIPSTNPSSWTVTGITFLWAFGLALARRTAWRSRRTWVLLAATVLSAVLAIGSRVDASAYAVMTVIVIALLTGIGRLRAAWISTIVLAVIAAAGLVNYVTFGTPGSGDGPMMGTNEPSPGLFLSNVVQLPVYLLGAVGGKALGWNDTIVPPMVGVFGVLALGALVYRGLVTMSPRKVLASLIALSALLAVPLAFLQREGLGVGEVVQARYLLPLIIVLFATLSLAIPYARPTDRGLYLPRAFAWVLGLGIAASAGLSLWINAHRYASGSTRGLFDIDLELEWTGITALPLPLVVGIGIAFTAVYVGFGTLGVYRDGLADGSGINAAGRKGSPTVASRPVR